MSIILIFLGGLGAGFIDAIVGGGGLISLPMMLAAGLPPQAALGTNKIIGVSSVLVSSYRYGRSGLADFLLIRRLFFFALLFGALGALGAAYAPNHVLRPVIMIGLCFAFLAFAKRDALGMVSRPPHPHANLALMLTISGLGFYDGFFGPGTGIFLMTMLTYFAGKSLLEASASARFLNLASNSAALFIFFLTGHLQPLFALPGALGSALGAYLGVQWSLKYGSKGIRQVALAVIVALVLRLAVQMLS